MNSVCLVGRLTRDPELRTTATGKSVASMSIAVSKRIKPQDGSPDADFFSVVAWGKDAEFATNYLTKGRLVSVEGRLQSRRYQASDGSNRDIVEVIASALQGLDRPRDDNGAKPDSARSHATPSAPAADEYDPFSDE